MVVSAQPFLVEHLPLQTPKQGQGCSSDLEGGEPQGEPQEFPATPEIAAGV